jgi:hypothetical protein
LTTLIDKLFDKHVTPEPNSGCWLWDGSLNADGYGNVRRGKITHKAHRYVYEKSHGMLGDGICVCHKCDVPNCVNPDHLFAGTHTENMRDRAIKGRNNWTKLSLAQVQAIKDDARMQKLVAREYGVSRALVCLIKSGKLQRVGA